MSTHPLSRLIERDSLRVIGLMSGTSLDGVDLALCTVTRTPRPSHPTVTLERARTVPYSAEERQRIAALFDTRTAELARGSFWLGAHFAGLLADFAESADLIASHGQTVWHEPPSMAKGGVASTLQLGEPAIIAARTGLVTVADFRVADVAVGGEGAPLVPYLDWVLFGHPGSRRALQNIGGIANITFLDGDAPPIAFDNGPGNMILDALVARITDGAESCDRDGAYSSAGRVVPAILAELLADDYLHAPPPKSTGRERYGHAFVDALVARHAAVALPDLLRTAVAFTAQAIADSLRFASGPIDELLLSGGGVHNPTLRGELRARLPGLSIRSLAEAGVDPDAKEAVAFAVFGAQTIWAQPANLPSVTGAARPAILGKICLP